MSDGWDRVHREIQATRDRLRQGLADPDAFFAERGFELGVNTGRKLTPLHRLKIDPLPAGRWSRCVVVGHPPEVAVLEAVAVAFE